MARYVHCRDSTTLRSHPCLQVSHSGVYPPSPYTQLLVLASEAVQYVFESILVHVDSVTSFQEQVGIDEVLLPEPNSYENKRTAEPTRHGCRPMDPVIALIRKRAQRTGDSRLTQTISVCRWRFAEIPSC